MSREVSIAVIQLPASPHGTTPAEIRASNFAAAEYWLDQAGARGAGIACIGETFNILGMALTPETLPDAIDGVLEEVITRLGVIAHHYGMVIIAPAAVRLDGTPRNAALLLNRSGELDGVFCKVHCTEMERALGIAPGSEWTTFALDFGRVGVQICHDNSFPESARCLALNGAEIVFWTH